MSYEGHPPKTTREMAEAIVEDSGLVPETPAHWALDVAEDYLALRREVKIQSAQWLPDLPHMGDDELDEIIAESKRREDYRTGAYE